MPAVTTTTFARPAGPAATLTALTGAGVPYLGEAGAPNLAQLRYTTHEFAAAGTATSYKIDGARTHDGRWKLVTDTTAADPTRVLVREPAERVEVQRECARRMATDEWRNRRESGVDEPAGRDRARRGDVWVGVSAERIGVEGGPVLVAVKGVPGAEQAGEGLKKINPARRYGTLVHPGDAAEALQRA